LLMSIWRTNLKRASGGTMKWMRVSVVILVAAVGSFTGCGGSGGGGGNGGTGGNGGGNTLTQPQAQQVATAISNDLSNALSSALSSPGAVPLGISSRDHIRIGLERRSETKGETMPDAVTCSGSSCTVSGTYTCPNGGSIQIAGNFSATNNSVNGSATETPTNCSDGTVDVGGAPNITLGLQGSDNGISTSVNVTLSGGVSWSPVQAGQFPSGSGSFNLTLSGTVNDSNKTVTACSITGSIDGQSISTNCSNLP
jgi:hypothetical protein